MVRVNPEHQGIKNRTLFSPPTRSGVTTGCWAGEVRRPPSADRSTEWSGFAPAHGDGWAYYNAGAAGAALIHQNFTISSSHTLSSARGCRHALQCHNFRQFLASVLRPDKPSSESIIPVVQLSRWVTAPPQQNPEYGEYLKSQFLDLFSTAYGRQILRLNKAK